MLWADAASLERGYGHLTAMDIAPIDACTRVTSHFLIDKERHSTQYRLQAVQR